MISYSFPRPDNFDISQIFDCGQSFRFLPCSNEPITAFEGVALGKYIKVTQNNNEITIFGTDETEFNQKWIHYFALDTDYSKLNKQILSARPDDRLLTDAMKYGSGIRLLNQDRFEALISFIISQNNNIPRIRSLIETISKNYGKEIVFENRIYYSFPDAYTLSKVSIEELRELKVGFRAPYIHDAATKVAGGEIDLDKIAELDTETLLNKLMKIKGVGLKVASCVALFSFSRLDCFPIDVWVKKVISSYYPEGFDHLALGNAAGLAQQYLFYYERYINSKK